MIEGGSSLTAEAPEEQDLLRASEVADLLGIKQPNVHKWIRVRGIKPAARDEARGWKLYSRAEIELARDTWVSTGGTATGGADANEKRRAAALARSAARAAS
jgi:hypothetical protein